jgi:putative phage-type endonuclease
MKDYILNYITKYIETIHKPFDETMRQKVNYQEIEIAKYVNIDYITDQLKQELSIVDEVDLYVLKELVNDCINTIKINENIYNQRRIKLQALKQLVLPEQRSPEWFEMRKTMLTASSLGSAIERGHFQTRDELLLSKIEETPYEANPITEWGVKYEEVAIMFYEELYNVSVIDFGLIPHPDFKAFGASPDGICDDTGNKDYIARMVEIKCPPKRKFTKTVPPHYGMQVQGQLEVCDLDQCDFFQVKLEEYNSYQDYCNDKFIEDDKMIEGRTILNYPKGATVTYKNGNKLSYIYCKLNQTNQQLLDWIDNQEKENLHEIKWWKIERYECTLVLRDKIWWINSIDKILLFYKDLLHYQKDENISELKDRVIDSKKRKKKIIPLIDFLLVSDDD